MPWYDWALWIGVLYMFIGSDFSLNWLARFAFGRRINRNSPNPIERLYYWVWASTDPNARADRVDGPADILAPWAACLCVINAVGTTLVELVVLYGMLQDDAPYLQAAAFAFLFRAVIELIYGSQLIWGPARLRGGSLANYLAIGLVPQVGVPCLLAMRYSGLGLTPLSVSLFAGLPTLVLAWMAILYRNNPVPALADRAD